jgi:hypothetical protein
MLQNVGKGNKMKKIEKLAIVLVVVWILQAVSTPGMFMLMARQQSGDISTFAQVLQYAAGLGSWLIAAVCGAWLFVEAQREKQTKWVWCLFGLLFKVQAIAIFYLYLIFQNMKSTGVANQALHATSETAPGAASEAHES